MLRLGQESRVSKDIAINPGIDEAWHYNVNPDSGRGELTSPMRLARHGRHRCSAATGLTWLSRPRIVLPATVESKLGPESLRTRAATISQPETATRRKKCQ
jgi:hypothetical protein